jgi:hypothetical protein
VFGVSHDSGRGRLLEPVPAKVNPAGGKANHIPLLLVLGAIPLLLANFFIVATILGRDCVTYEGGNITECIGGLSEEKMSAASGPIALVLLVIQIVLIILVNRRIRARS